MRDGSRAELAARGFLSVAALLPYWRLLTLSVIFVTDGAISSDIYNGELPGRLLAAQWLRAGRLPVWTSQMCSGYPLAGSPSDPLGLALFTGLPPAPALDLLLLILLLVMAHGTYSLARRLGADRAGAVLAGMGFAGSGYVATQLQHLSIMSTIAWLPAGLILIDRILSPATRRGRGLLMALLGLLYANQLLAGFPQAAHMCGLLYGGFAIFRAISQRDALGPMRVWLPMLAGIGAALILGAAAGAVVLLPLMELGSLSDRAGALDYRWATYTSYWPRNVFSFFVPYINGDGSNGTYIGPPPFWENYGYVGAATACLAIYGAVRERRRPVVAFVILMTLASFAMILGGRTPAYYVAYLLIPGMNRFRAPTRFLVLVDLGVVLLGAIGLTRLRVTLERRWPQSRAAAMIPLVICVATALDLFIHQTRQNPMVPASTWLAAPATVDMVRAGTAAPRTFTPHHRGIHRHLHEQVNHGWTNVQPYFELRDLLEPDIGGAYWNVPSADCYVGLSPRWYVDVWGYHYFERSLMGDAAVREFEPDRFTIHPGFSSLLRAYGVTHMLSPSPGPAPGLTLVDRTPQAYVYRVDGAARARVVSAVRRVATDEAALMRLRDPAFDPDREILLIDAPDTLHPTVDDVAATGGHGRATITREDARELVVEAVAEEDGFLLLADTYYPGWRAQVDGTPTPIYRANVSVRGVALPKGTHTVRFDYDPEPFFRGLRVTVTALAALLVWLAVAWAQRHG